MVSSSDQSQFGGYSSEDESASNENKLCLPSLSRNDDFFIILKDTHQPVYLSEGYSTKDKKARPFNFYHWTENLSEMKTMLKSFNKSHIDSDINCLFNFYHVIEKLSEVKTLFKSFSKSLSDSDIEILSNLNYLTEKLSEVTILFNSFSKSLSDSVSLINKRQPRNLLQTKYIRQFHPSSSGLTRENDTKNLNGSESLFNLNHQTEKLSEMKKLFKSFSKSPTDSDIKRLLTLPTSLVCENWLFELPMSQRYENGSSDHRHPAEDNVLSKSYRPSEITVIELIMTVIDHMLNPNGTSEKVRTGGNYVILSLGKEPCTEEGERETTKGESTRIPVTVEVLKNAAAAAGNDVGRLFNGRLQDDLVLAYITVYPDDIRMRIEIPTSLFSDLHQIDQCSS